MSATTALVFVGMPLAVMLWPIPELAWIARSAMRAFGVVLVIPLAWAVCFATFAAVGVDALSLKGAGKIVDALVHAAGGARAAVADGRAAADAGADGDDRRIRVGRLRRADRQLPRRAAR